MSPKSKASKTTAAANNYAVSKFRGGLEQIVEASVLGGVNGLVITAPGWGKSKMVYHMGRQIYGDASLLLECSPATQPEKIEGRWDYFQVTQGVYVRIVEGTPADQNVMFVSLDEAPRLPDPAYDQLLPMLQRIDYQHQAVFVGSGNFFVTGARTEAFYDRFALNFVPTLSMDEQSIDEVVMGVDFEQRVYNLPTASDVTEVRSADYGNHALTAIRDFVLDLYGLMGGTPFEKRVNPRRLSQWREVLFRVGTYYTGDNDFKSLPNQAVSVMRYAMPVKSEAEWLEWSKITGALADKVATIIETVLGEAYNSFLEVRSAKDPNARLGMLTKIAEISNTANEQLAPYVTDPRTEEAIDTVNEWFRLASAGKDLPAYNG